MFWKFFHRGKEAPLVGVGSHMDDGAGKAENPLQFLSSRDNISCHFTCKVAALKLNKNH